ncbi:hypothetical protein FQN54_009532 [Arachnomyces sp. PD_36]|nr:hypothetical protein FQN54_009532 [Arachnomyces sp. PD_36]
MFTPTSILLSTAVLFPGLSLAANPPYFILAGDSTTATHGGWGDAFISDSLVNGSEGANYASSGTTTISFDSSWDGDVIPAIATAKEDGFDPYVTIQFGHNDQKSDDAMAVFIENLENFVQEARDAGATPVILTSLSRRNFDTDADPPIVEDDLENVRQEAIQAAEEVEADYADLNTRSREYLSAIGSENADTYNLDGTDRTHLSDEGGVVFGGLVAQLVVETFPDLADYVIVDAELGEALDSGEYWYPS